MPSCRVIISLPLGSTSSMRIQRAHQQSDDGNKDESNAWAQQHDSPLPKQIQLLLLLNAPCLQQRPDSYLASDGCIGPLPLWREQQLALLGSTSTPNVGLPLASSSAPLSGTLRNTDLVIWVLSRTPSNQGAHFMQIKYDNVYTTMESSRLTMYCFTQK